MATRRKKYQQVIEHVTSVDQSALEGSLDEVIEYLEALTEKYPTHTRLYLDFDAGHNNLDIDLHGHRPETDRERDSRLDAARVVRATAAERQNQNTEAEKKEFFRLHEKFGHLL
jgi:hypothetical protein